MCGYSQFVPPFLGTRNCSRRRVTSAATYSPTQTLFSSVTFIFKEGFNTMFILVFTASSAVSYPLYLPSERITQSSKRGPHVYCLIPSSCIQIQLHTSNTEACQLSLYGGNSSHGRYISFQHLSAAEISFTPESIYI